MFDNGGQSEDSSIVKVFVVTFREIKTSCCSAFAAGFGVVHVTDMEADAGIWVWQRNQGVDGMLLGEP